MKQINLPPNDQKFQSEHNKEASVSSGGCFKQTSDII